MIAAVVGLALSASGTASLQAKAGGQCPKGAFYFVSRFAAGYRVWEVAH